MTKQVTGRKVLKSQECLEVGGTEVSAGLSSPERLYGGQES
jgi:hypothetical protein